MEYIENLDKYIKTALEKQTVIEKTLEEEEVLKIKRK